MDKMKLQAISEKIGGFASPIVMLVVSRNSAQLENTKEYILNQLNVSLGDIFEIEPGVEGKKEVITIKQARALIHWINLRPQKSHKAAFIYKLEQMTEEAANALLKTLEEPPKYSVIVLFSASKDILPTIKSRSRVITLEDQGENVFDHGCYIKAFLKSSFCRQSNSIEEIIKQEKVADFLRSMESWARGELIESKNIEYASLAEEIFTTRKNLRANVNSKLALENLVLKFRDIVQ